jgi:tetratricopeptide (TPR) repeat protein
MDNEIVIEPLTVPKSLAERGYTGEVAANNLRDALNDFISLAHSTIPTPDVALQADMPDIVVPSVGISLNSIAVYIRMFLGLGHHREITGALFTTSKDILTVALWMNGQSVFHTQETTKGANEPGELIKLAAPAIINQISPYLVAAAEIVTDTDEARKLINYLIATRPSSDKDALWATTLKAILLNSEGKHQDAEKILSDLIQQYPGFVLAHQDLALVFQSEGEPDHAIAELRRGLRLNKSRADAHSVLGELLYEKNKFTDAITELKIAVGVDPANARIRYLLGASLLAEGSITATRGEAFRLFKDACDEFTMGSYVATDSDLYYFAEGISHANAHFPDGPHCVLDPTIPEPIPPELAPPPPPPPALSPRHGW